MATRPLRLRGPDGLPATVAQMIYYAVATHVLLTLGDGSKLVAHWATEDSHLLARPA